MASIPTVDIDLEETQKYILVSVTGAALAAPVTVIRGRAAAEFHADVLAACEAALTAGAGAGAALDALGGGRITFSPPSTYRVHGYSVAFGKGDHAAAAAALRAALPGATVTHDDEGY